VDGLIQSPAHRENILNSQYTHLAIAAAAKGEGVVVVQLFEARRALLAERLPLHAKRGEKLPLKFEQGQDLAVPPSSDHHDAEACGGNARAFPSTKGGCATVQL
jgi:hypothetical protein